MSSADKHMVVAVRVRPLSSREIETGCTPCCEVINNSIVAIRKRGTGGYLKSEQESINEYQFDTALGEDSSQADVYEQTAKSFIPHVFAGLNVTVFCYGATGAGKTHTMLGNTRCDDAALNADAGIIPNAVHDIFEQLANKKENNFDEQWSVIISFMEVYNEQVYDLLQPTGKPLSVREDQERSLVVVAGLCEQLATSYDDVMDLLQQGNLNRKTEATNANAVSSRSHAIFQITMRKTFRSANGRESMVDAKLSLIDLAGSERASATNNRGVRLMEGANINKSLLALANCINALSVGSNKKNVKYRDSKLTHLLKSSLEGNCKLVMIANVNPSHLTYEDSHNTIKYANRAKSLKLDPTAKEVVKASNWVEREAALVEENNRLKDRVHELEALVDELRATIKCVDEKGAGHFTEQSNDTTTRGKVMNGMGALDKVAPTTHSLTNGYFSSEPAVSKDTERDQGAKEADRRESRTSLVGVKTPSHYLVAPSPGPFGNPLSAPRPSAKKSIKRSLHHSRRSSESARKESICSLSFEGENVSFHGLSDSVLKAGLFDPNTTADASAIDISPIKASRTSTQRASMPSGVDVGALGSAADSDMQAPGRAKEAWINRSAPLPQLDEEEADEEMVAQSTSDSVIENTAQHESQEQRSRPERGPPIIVEDLEDSFMNSSLLNTTMEENDAAKQRRKRRASAIPMAARPRKSICVVAMREKKDKEHKVEEEESEPLFLGDLMKSEQQPDEPMQSVEPTISRQPLQEVTNTQPSLPSPAPTKKVSSKVSTRRSSIARVTKPPASENVGDAEIANIDNGAMPARANARRKIVLGACNLSNQMGAKPNSRRKSLASISEMLDSIPTTFEDADNVEPQSEIIVSTEAGKKPAPRRSSRRSSISITTTAEASDAAGGGIMTRAARRRASILAPVLETD
jgi:hypothetical protein